jgi:hypothetical protein
LATTTSEIRPQRIVVSDDVPDENTSTRGQSSGQVLARIGAVSALVGAIILMTSTMLHPGGSHPDDHHAAFTEYAADSMWVWSHLGQFLGFALLGVALAGLAMTLESGRPAAWGRIGLVGTAALVAVAAMLQAVDGVALKVMVDRWATATGEAQALAFDSTIAVRQIEIGLASFLSLVTGLTLIVFGLALMLSFRYPTWLGMVGTVGGVGTLAGGVAQATSGFSDLSMSLSMPSGFVVILWAILAGIFMWRLAPRLGSADERV